MRTECDGRAKCAIAEKGVEREGLVDRPLKIGASSLSSLPWVSRTEDLMTGFGRMAFFKATWGMGRGRGNSIAAWLKTVMRDHAGGSCVVETREAIFERSTSNCLKDCAVR